MSQRFYKKLLPQQLETRQRFWQFFAVTTVILFPLSMMHLGIHALNRFLPEEQQDRLHLIYEAVILLLSSFLYLLYLRKKDEYVAHLANEARLKLFIKHAPSAVAMLDRDMNYLVVSDRWLKDYNIQENDITGKNHYDIFPMIRKNPIWMDDHKRALELGETTRRDEDNFIGLSGKREWLTYEIVPWYDIRNKIGGLIFYTEVITLRMEILERLRESEARFARAMRGSNDGIFDWDVQKNTVYFSPRFKRFLGYSEEEVSNNYEGFVGLLHPDDIEHTKQKVEDHLYRHEPYKVQYRLRKKNGEYVWIEARGQTEWDNEGKPTYFSGIMTDISESKRLEELRKEFVYVVTHELRTPLSALRGALDVLPHLLGRQLPQKAEKSLDLALQGCDRLALLVDDLLTAGRAETDSIAVELEICDIATMLEKSIEMNNAYCNKYGARLELEKELPHCRLQLDKGRFMQVMANLLSNAAKFSPPCGVVEVTASCDEQYVTVSVKDHGSGIPEEFQRKIFQKFARGQSDKPGTGLGLNIAKTMVEKMQGKIWFETEIGKGTVFFLRFSIVP